MSFWVVVAAIPLVLRKGGGSSPPGLSGGRRKRSSQKAGNHPNLKKEEETLSEWKRPFSEQLSEFQGILGAILGMGLRRPNLCENPYSRGNSRSDSRNWLDAKISAQILGAFFSKFGWCLRARIGAKNWTQTFFFPQTFRDFAGISQQNPEISHQKSLISLAWRDIPNFLAQPLHVKDPHSNRKYPDPKVWVWVRFSSPTEELTN